MLKIYNIIILIEMDKIENEVLTTQPQELQSQSELF